MLNPFSFPDYLGTWRWLAGQSGQSATVTLLTRLTGATHGQNNLIISSTTKQKNLD